MQVTVIDTETTGLDGDIVELAAVTITPLELGYGITNFCSSLVQPTKPIEFAAMGIHHITEAMVVGEPSLATVLDALELSKVDILAAHNAEFDKKGLPKELRDKRWICTWRCAMHLWPGATTHSNQGLRYELGLDVSDMPAECGGNAHRALYDAWCTAKLLAEMLKLRSAEQLVDLTRAPIIFQKVSFGKHYGELWSKVPKSYLQWVVRQDMSADIIATAKHYL